MRQAVRDVKHVKQHREGLLQNLSSLQQEENRLTDAIQQNRMKQAKVGYEVRDATNKVMDLIEDLT